MSAEKSVGFNESLSKSFDLAEKFRKADVIGEKSQEQNNLANEKVREILSTGFPIHYQADEQYNNIPQYEDVAGMIEISNNFSKTDAVRERAKNNLFEIGLALSQNKEIFKAATEGTDELNKLIPSRLHEIHPFILSVSLTNGKDDAEGQELVGELVNLFKLKKKANERPDFYESDFKEASKNLFDKLYERREDLTSAEVEDGTEGRIETEMGYILGMSEKKVDRSDIGREVAGKDKKGIKGEDLPPLGVKKSRDEDPDSKKESATRSWEVDPERMADALKFMADDLRWSSWTPPEWFKELDGETQARIEYMVMVNEGAAGLSYAGPNLDKIMANKMYFAFDNEKFTKLFNEDFKLVTSKMLNDLCEFYKDQNDRACLRYKETFYKKTNDDKWVYETIDGKKIRVKGVYKSDIGAFDVNDNVFEKLTGIRNYKEEMATFLAEQNGRKEANYMDRMNAYTAWNLFYMFGDSSLADRMRVLPTFGGIINDGLRTLNPEYKALGKWKVSKGEKANTDDELFEAEYFGGPVSDWVQTIMRMEKDLKNPIDGKKRLRNKIIDKDIRIFANKTCYGFFDFTYGSRDLYKPNGEKFEKEEDVTLAKLVRNYGFNKDGSLKDKNIREEFSFGNSQVDFLNLYRDQIEMAALSFNCMTGKVEVKSPTQWARTVKDKLGMVNGIKINGKPTYSYTSSPDYWANMILGSFGVDMTRLSSTDHIRLKTEITGGYNFYVRNFLTKSSNLGLSEINVDLVKLMQYLGVSLNPGERLDSIKVTKRNQDEWVGERDNTAAIKRRIGGFIG